MHVKEKPEFNSNQQNNFSFCNSEVEIGYYFLMICHIFTICFNLNILVTHVRKVKKYTNNFKLKFNRDLFRIFYEMKYCFLNGHF